MNFRSISGHLALLTLLIPVAANGMSFWQRAKNQAIKYVTTKNVALAGLAASAAGAGWYIYKNMYDSKLDPNMTTFEAILKPAASAAPEPAALQPEIPANRPSSQPDVANTPVEEPVKVISMDPIIDPMTQAVRLNETPPAQPIIEPISIGNQDGPKNISLDIYDENPMAQALLLNAVRPGETEDFSDLFDSVQLGQIPSVNNDIKSEDLVVAIAKNIPAKRSLPLHAVISETTAQTNLEQPMDLGQSITSDPDTKGFVTIKTSDPLLTIISSRTKTEQEKIAALRKELQNPAIDIDAIEKNLPLMNPLIRAAALGHLKIAQFLLERGANINKQGGFDNTALMYAAREGNLDIVQLMLEHGANVSLKNENNNTALIFMLAGYGAAVAKAKTIEEKNKFKEDTYAIAKLLLKAGIDINVQSHKEKRNAIMWAALYYRFDIVKLLLESGANVHAIDNEKNTLLMLLPDSAKAKQLELQGLISAQDYNLLLDIQATISKK